MSKKVTILLTACVNPNGMSFTALQDGTIRKQQYVDALYYYLEETSLPIVFVENTNTDFSDEFKQYIDSNRLEYITFDGNNSFDKIKGKGYGEALIMLYAFENSEFLKNSDYVYKITGRLKVTNVQKESQSLFLHIPHLYRSTLGDQKYATTGVFLCEPQTMQKILLRHKEEISEIDRGNNWIENIVYNALINDKDLNYTFIPFYKGKAMGVTGSSNKPYYNKPTFISLTDGLFEWYIFQRKRQKSIQSKLIYLLYRIVLLFRFFNR